MKKKDMYLNKLYAQVSINESNQVSFKFRDDKYDISISQNPYEGENWSRVAPVTDIDRILYGVTTTYINYLVDRIHLLYKIGDFPKITMTLEDEEISISFKKKDKDGNVVEQQARVYTNDAAIFCFLYPGSYPGAEDKNTLFTKINDLELRETFEGLLNLVYHIYRDAYLFKYRQELM